MCSPIDIIFGFVSPSAYSQSKAATICARKSSGVPCPGGRKYFMSFVSKLYGMVSHFSPSTWTK